MKEMRSKINLDRDCKGSNGSSYGEKTSIKTVGSITMCSGRSSRGRGRGTSSTIILDGQSISSSLSSVLYNNELRSRFTNTRAINNIPVCGTNLTNK
jgi:hypothetical protein